MAWADYIQREGIAYIPFILISGIPYVFSSHNQPAGWALASGYSWSRSAIWFRGEGGNVALTMGGVGQKIDFMSGITVSGQIELEFGVDQDDPDDVWRAMLVPDAADRFVTYLDPDYRALPHHTALVTQGGDILLVGDIRHFGTEAMEIRGVSGTQHAVTRGIYDSEPAFIGSFGPPGTNLGGPPELTSWPRTWRGRTVEVWLAACEVSNAGVLVPIDTALRGASSSCVFQGVLYEQRWGESYLSTVFTVQSLEQVLERPVITRAREFRVGAGIGIGQVFVEANGPCLVEYDAGPTPLVGTSVPGAGVIDLSDSGMPFRGGKLVGGAELMEAICAELGSASGGALHSASPHLWIQFAWIAVPDETTGAVRVRMSANLNGSDGLLRTLTLRVASARNQEKSVLWALGATEDVIFPADDAEFDGALGGSIATFASPVPLYYLAEGSSRIYYRLPAGVDANLLTHDPPPYQGTFDRDGNLDYPCIRFGKSHISRAIFRTLGAGSAMLVDTDVGPTAYYAILYQNNLFGSLRKAWTVKTEDAETENGKLFMGLGFTNHDLLDVLRWLACSTGDPVVPLSVWNVLPQGYGAGIPSDFFDHASWNTAQDERGPVATNWYIDGKETMRELCAMVGKAYGLTFLPYSVPGAGYTIGCSITVPPDFTAVPDYEIDESWTDPLRQAIEVVRNERGVVNKIEFEYDWDPIARVYNGKNNSYVHASSIKNYGLSKPFVVRLPWIRATADVRLTLDPLAWYIFAALGEPPVEITVPCVRWEAWGVRPDKSVTLTHRMLPNYREGGFGVTAEPLQVHGTKQHYGPDGAYAAELQLLWRNTGGARFAPYVPCLRVLEVVTGSTYRVATSDDDGGFGPREGVKRDIEFYELADDFDWLVRAFERGVDVAQLRAVTAVDVDANEITLSSALTGNLADPEDHVVVIEFTNYVNLGDGYESQEAFAFLADEDSLELEDDDGNIQVAARWS